MSPQAFKFPLGQIVFTGLALLLGNASAIASPLTFSTFSVAQTQIPPVVVDTDGGTVPTPNGGSIPAPTSGTRFSCQMQNGEYTVMYQPESQSNQYFAWATPAAMGGGWGADRRCTEIARRLESYRPDGLLELTTSVENGYNTVCVTTEQDPNCRIVFTVPPGQDALLTRDRVFENLTVADSGQQTDSVYTYRSRNNGMDQLLNIGRDILGNGNNSRARSKKIDLRPFLDRNDGGTGSKLRGGASKPTKSQLNPGSFR